MLEKCVLTILKLNWNQRLGHEKLPSCGHVVHTTAKQVISRRRKNENVFKMSKDEKFTCKACKNTVFHCQICKFVGFCCCRSRGWLSSLISHTANPPSSTEKSKTTCKRIDRFQSRDHFTIGRHISIQLHL